MLISVFSFNLQKEEKRANEANELSLANVGGVFVVLLAGMGLACLIAVFEFIWKSRKLATDENVRHSKLIAKALSHTNENMFHVPKHETGFSKSIQDPSVIANAASIAFGFVDRNEFLRQTAHQTYMSNREDQRNPHFNQSEHCITSRLPILT